VVDNSVFQTSGRFLGAAISASSGSQEAMVLGNRITEAGRGVYGFGSSRPRCRDNVTSMVGVAYTGHTDLGNNH
jgi:nitrous oxidase accessory protein NosD